MQKISKYKANLAQQLKETKENEEKEVAKLKLHIANISRRLTEAKENEGKEVAKLKQHTTNIAQLLKEAKENEGKEVAKLKLHIANISQILTEANEKEGKDIEKLKQHTANVNQLLTKAKEQLEEKEQSLMKNKCMHQINNKNESWVKFILNIATSKAKYADTNGQLYVNFKVNEKWTSEQLFFGGVNLGEVKSKDFTLENYPTQLRIKTYQENAYSYWKIWISGNEHWKNNNVILENKNGEVGTEYGNNIFWVDSNGSDRGVKDEQIFNIP